MNFADWYTDRMDIYRVTERTEGMITRHARALAASGVPCRVYQSGKSPITMRETAADIHGVGKLMCGLEADVRKGDELLITRSGKVSRHFAGQIQDYPEPFGAVLPGLAHRELTLSEEERA